jgi:hypothetical protein
MAIVSAVKLIAESAKHCWPIFNELDGPACPCQLLVVRSLRCIFIRISDNCLQHLLLGMLLEGLAIVC